MTNTDERPLRAVPPDEPPFDPYPEQPPAPKYEQNGRQPPHDYDAERAVLATLLASSNPDGTHPGEELATLLEPGDFYLPEHETIWTTWHALHASTAVPPDAVTLNAQLVRAKDERAVRALAGLMASPANPLLAEHHAKIVRDAARLRVVDGVATGLRDLVTRARADQVEHYLGEALQRLDETVTRFGPTSLDDQSGYRDLSWILTGHAPEIPPPTWVQHDAGHALFYAGKVNGVFGDPETAKTWLAQCAIVEALNSGGTAAMVDVDHNGENHTAARLMLLGAHPAAIADGTKFRYYDPQEGAELRNAITDITAHRPDVVLIDSLGEIFPMLGLNTNDGDEITGGLRLISKPADTGSCVIFIDHLPKSSEARATGFAIGSIAKKRAIRGSYIRAEERVKPAPGQVGKISLFIEKDTSGELRRATPGGKYIGVFVLDSTAPHTTSWHILRDDAPTGTDGQVRPTHLMEAISRHIEQNDQCSFRDIKEAISGKDKWLRQAIRLLVDEGFVSTMAGPRNSTKHHTIALYREAEDDQV